MKVTMRDLICSSSIEATALTMCGRIADVLQAFKEIRGWNIQDARQVIKAACCDAVGANFVFLNLLKRKF